MEKQHADDFEMAKGQMTINANTQRLLSIVIAKS